MSLTDVAKQAGIAASEVKLISTRPNRIEELDWRTNRVSSSSARADSVQQVLFSFYNGALFEMMVTYDKDRTGGLTDADMVESISGIYGHTANSSVKEMTFNSGYSNTVRVVARWEDADDMVSLVGFTYGGGYGAVVSSTSNQLLAQRSIVESERLDRVEAPQRELARQAQESADAQAKDEKSRVSNKPGFRP